MKAPKNNLNTQLKKKELSARESEVLELLIKGHTNRSIAGQLFISHYTAKRHTENIYRKLQVHSRVELLVKFTKSRRS